MEEGSGTRSSLLWEVKRLLEEVENLPDFLLMENVPMVHSKQNIKAFNRWLAFLESRGYTTVYADLNAKNYGIPQSRNRTFALSWLGNHTYKFPQPIELETCMRDYLEPEVDEKYYITNEKAWNLIDRLVKENKIPIPGKGGVDLSTSQAKLTDICSCIKARYDGGINLPKNERTGVCEVSKYDG